MNLLFWICTILLGLAVVLGYRAWPPARDGALVLVCIDLLLLGIRVFQLPH